MMYGDLRGRMDGMTAAEDRVSWLERPQGDGLPAITLQAIVDGREQHLKGFQGLQRSMIQLDVWARSYVEAQAVADAAEAAVVPSGDAGATRFARTMIENRNDKVDRLDGAAIFRVSMDLIVHHQPA